MATPKTFPGQLALFSLYLLACFYLQHTTAPGASELGQHDCMQRRSLTRGFALHTGLLQQPSAQSLWMCPVRAIGKAFTVHRYVFWPRSKGARREMRGQNLHQGILFWTFLAREGIEPNPGPPRPAGSDDKDNKPQEQGAGASSGSAAASPYGGQAPPMQQTATHQALTAQQQALQQQALLQQQQQQQQALLQQQQQQAGVQQPQTLLQRQGDVVELAAEEACANLVGADGNVEEEVDAELQDSAQAAPQSPTGDPVQDNLEDFLKRHCTKLRAATPDNTDAAAVLKDLLAFAAASGEVHTGGKRGQWYKMEAPLLWMAVQAGLQQDAPPGLKAFAYAVVTHIHQQEAIGMQCQFDKAHANLYLEPDGQLVWHNHAFSMRIVMREMAQLASERPDLQSNLRISAHSTSFDMRLVSTTTNPLPANRACHSVELTGMEWVVLDNAALGKAYLPCGLFRRLEHSAPAAHTVPAVLQLKVPCGSGGEAFLELFTATTKSSRQAACFTNAQTQSKSPSQKKEARRAGWGSTSCVVVQVSGVVHSNRQQLLSTTQRAINFSVRLPGSLPHHNPQQPRSELSAGLAQPHCVPPLQCANLPPSISVRLREAAAGCTRQWWRQPA